MVRILKQTSLQHRIIVYKQIHNSNQMPKAITAKSPRKKHPATTNILPICVVYTSSTFASCATVQNEQQFDPNNANLFESDYAYILQMLKITQILQCTE